MGVVRTHSREPEPVHHLLVAGKVILLDDRESLGTCACKLCTSLLGAHRAHETSGSARRAPTAVQETNIMRCTHTLQRTRSSESSEFMEGTFAYTNPYKMFRKSVSCAHYVDTNVSSYASDSVDHVANEEKLWLKRAATLDLRRPAACVLGTQARDLTLCAVEAECARQSACANVCSKQP